MSKGRNSPVFGTATFSKTGIGQKLNYLKQAGRQTSPYWLIFTKAATFRSSHYKGEISRIPRWKRGTRNGYFGYPSLTLKRMSHVATTGGGKEGGELFVWKAESGERLAAFEENSKVASAIAWSLSGEILISGGSDGMLRWWEVSSGQCIRVSQGHKGIVQALRVAPDGSRLASCGDDGTIMLWNLENGEHIKTLRRDRLYERLNITGITGISEAQKAMLHTLGGYEEPSINQ